MKYYIGMDVGGTYSRIKVVDPDGSLLYQGSGEGGTISSAGYDIMEQHFHHLLSTALFPLNLHPQDCLKLCLGASGIDSEELKCQYERILTSFGFSSAIIDAYNDCELLTLLMPLPCIALISGTGSIAMGRSDASSQVIRCGGWSFLLSDEGSGAAISFAVMRDVLKHWDHQVECPLLAEAFTRQTGIHTPAELVHWFHTNLHRKDVLAQIAPIVEMAATAGDVCALRILSNAAEQLFSLVDTMVHRMHLEHKPFSVLLWGSVLLQNDSIRHLLTEKISKAYPLAETQVLQSSALDCAVQIAMGLPFTAMCRPALAEEEGAV